MLFRYVSAHEYIYPIINSPIKTTILFHLFTIYVHCITLVLFIRDYIKYINCHSICPFISNSNKNNIRWNSRTIFFLKANQDIRENKRTVFCFLFYFLVNTMLQTRYTYDRYNKVFGYFVTIINELMGHKTIYNTSTCRLFADKVN